MTKKTTREVAEHLVTVHGGVLVARDWAEAHACANIGRNSAAVEHWDAVAAVLTEMWKNDSRAG